MVIRPIAGRLAAALPALNGVRPGRQRRRTPAIAAGVWSRQRFALRPVTLAAIRLAAVSRRQGRLAAQGATSDFAAGPRPGLRPVMAACGGPLLIFLLFLVSAYAEIAAHHLSNLKSLR